MTSQAISINGNAYCFLFYEPRSTGMNAIPAFGGNGLIPPFRSDPTSRDRSPYKASSLDLAKRFASTLDRIAILDGFFKYRALLYKLEYKDGIQFINGSFVEDTDKNESRSPGDIDVFSYLSRPQKYVANPSLWLKHGIKEWEQEIADNFRNKKRFRVDSYALSDDSLQVEDLIEDIAYWSGLFSHCRTTFEWKGFVQVALDEKDDRAALDHLEERTKTVRRRETQVSKDG